MKYRTTKEKRFDAIYQDYANDIYRVSLHLTKDESLAQEITQQAFVNCYDYFEKVSQDCIYAYLVRAVNEIMNDRCFKS